MASRARFGTGMANSYASLHGLASRAQTSYRSRVMVIVRHLMAPVVAKDDGTVDPFETGTVVWAADLPDTNGVFNLIPERGVGAVRRGDFNN